MIDRAINLITLLFLLLALIVLMSNTYIAWLKVESWEQSWVVIEDAEKEYTSEQLLTAIKNAQSKNEYSDAYRIEEILKSVYKPSGNVSVRVNTSELVDIAIYTISILLLLVIPISINYIRRGVFSLWNKN
ncbi:MAG: hypothetical protein H0W44_00860 [Gammaproteobacteria bacterium]|nr:hypothetical protein [Gammaproteobacteria bacterium]